MASSVIGNATERHARRPSATCGEASLVCPAEILIEGFPTDAQLTGQGGLPGAGLHPVAELRRLLGRERFLAAPIGLPLLGQSDALALPFADQGPLEFGEGPHDRQQ